MTSSDKTRSQTIATIERAADVLDAFGRAEGKSLGVTELAESLGLSKAVVHRILSSLRLKGLVELDEETRRYGLGPATLALGLAYLQGIDIRDRARPVLRSLSQQTNETATMSVRRGNTRIYVDQVTPPREVKMTVRLGRPFPLHAGGSSKTFLAHLSEDDIEEYLSRDLERLTAETVVSKTNLRAELKEILEKGYGVSYGERQEGAGSVAAPVFDHEGAPVAVISVCGPVERFRGEVDEVVPFLLEATRGLSRQLGWQGG